MSNNESHDNTENLNVTNLTPNNIDQDLINILTGNQILTPEIIKAISEICKQFHSQE